MSQYIIQNSYICGGDVTVIFVDIVATVVKVILKTSAHESVGKSSVYLFRGKLYAPTLIHIANTSPSRPPVTHPYNEHDNRKHYTSVTEQETNVVQLNQYILVD
jgi:hypothetical protein